MQSHAVEQIIRCLTRVTGAAVIFCLIGLIRWVFEGNKLSDRAKISGLSVSELASEDDTRALLSSVEALIQPLTKIKRNLISEAKSMVAYGKVLLRYHIQADHAEVAAAWRW